MQDLTCNFAYYIYASTIYFPNIELFNFVKFDFTCNGPNSMHYVFFITSPNLRNSNI